MLSKIIFYYKKLFLKIVFKQTCTKNTVLLLIMNSNNSE